MSAQQLPSAAGGAPAAASGDAGGDADEDGDVDFNDLITLLSAFGPCP